MSLPISYKGSEWRRWDLHFHTPSSFDYRNKSISNEEIINELISNNISVVAITDHHVIDVARIVELKKLAGDKITILPGIELRSELGGSETIHFIGIFAEDSKFDEIWLDLQSRCNLKASQVELVGDDKVYCDLKDTCDLIHELGGLVSIHAGGKSNTIESIKNNHTFKRKIKTDLVRDYIDIYELGAVEDQDDYNNIVFPAIGLRRPLIICSDNHDIKRYNIKEKLWIKADPNFEGLKQIIHEPEDRVRIQANLPEDKAGYQVIDRIEISSSFIYNNKIELNPNLNSLIGGRSAGKSILLAAIAKKLKTDKPVRFEHNLEYDEFVSDISMAIKVFWKDKEEKNEREIEYFEQGYMHDLARKEEKLSKLIQDILKQKGKEPILNSFEKYVSENKKKISDLLSDLFRNIKDTADKEQKARDKGDKKGIEDEILRLSDELKKLSITSITEEEKQVYESCKEKIEKAKESKAIITQDILSIELLKDTSLFKDSIAYELISISEGRKNNIEGLFARLKTEMNQRWLAELNSMIEEAKNSETVYDQQIAIASADEIYQKVSRAFSDSTQFSEFEGRIQVQKTKLFEITTLISEIEELKKQCAILKQDIISAHKEYFEKISLLLPNLSEATDGLEINARAKFNEKYYREILYSGLNQQGYVNQAISNFEFKENKDYEVHFVSVFQKLIKNELTLKGGYTNQSLLNSLMTECFYYLSYDIEYDGDDFKKMSDGKKAFVVLKLLLDFSNKDCPILIDQPEDDLDNRAIYLDLVQYLKRKKKLRQIIVATHNPNIVVGADSELIIVANQDGIKNINKGRKKFQYVSGSLEYTCKKDPEIKEVLDCQGVREHICEILEGGDKAFKLRERKYSLPEQLEKI